MGNYIAAPTFFFYRACLELTLKFLFYIYFTKSNSPAMKKMILVFTVMVSCTALQAQNYKRVFYKDQTVENKNMSIQIVDAVATDAEVKFKMKIKNLMSTDYILYKATESSFKIDGKTIKCQGSLTIAGTTRQIEVEATYTVSTNGSIQCKGSKKLAMSDYNIEPPSFMFGSVTTGNDITVSFDVVLAPKTQTVSLN